MKSDIFHLYPTLELPNNRRANYPFGVVVGTPTYEVGGSKLGVDFENAIVFEPRNVHKGNVARSLFYFAVKYGNQGGYMSGKQENVLRQWNVSDPVNAREMSRNDKIKTFQNTRNPFIDHPEFIDPTVRSWNASMRSRAKWSCNSRTSRFDRRSGRSKRDFGSCRTS